MKQTALELETPEAACKAPEELVQALRTALADGQWHTARELAASTAIGDRMLRIIAQENPDEFATGNQGYKRMEFCTVAELQACAARLLAQAKKMEARAVKLLARAHRALNQREDAAQV